jgi:ATP-dependent RNA helicase RhlE
VRFDELGLIEPIAAAVRAEGYTEPTPIQAQAIPHVLAGKDLLGLAQTGTGKTAAFALPILQRLHEKGYHPHGERPIRVLVLTPTRELAAQIGESFATYGKNLGYKHTVIFGGVGQQAQERALRSGIDILVATPGRLLDLAQQRVLHFKSLDIFVLDEADRMLDMGFIHDVRKIIAMIPKERQTLFFSATMPPEAQKLADVLLKNPETVAVTPVSSTAERIEQSMYFVEKNDKRALLVQVLKDPSIKRALVFSRTKHGANRIAEHLHKANIRAEAIHGNKSQNARERALAGFKAGQTRVLVATDIAARGIDIDEITHVVNFDLPNVPETYVHRIGRTARAGASGKALSFCDMEEREFLRDIERLIRQSIPVVPDHPHRSSLPPPSGGGGGGAPRRSNEFMGGGGVRRPAPPPRGRDSQRPPQPRSNGGGNGGGGGGGRGEAPVRTASAFDPWAEDRAATSGGAGGAPAPAGGGGGERSHRPHGAGGHGGQPRQAGGGGGGGGAPGGRRRRRGGRGGGGGGARGGGGGGAQA